MESITIPIINKPCHEIVKSVPLTVDKQRCRAMVCWGWRTSDVRIFVDRHTADGWMPVSSPKSATLSPSAWTLAVGRDDTLWAIVPFPTVVAFVRDKLRSAS